MKHTFNSALYKITFTVETGGTKEYTNSVVVRAEDLEHAIDRAGAELSTQSKFFGTDAMYKKDVLITKGVPQ